MRACWWRFVVIALVLPLTGVRTPTPTTAQQIGTLGNLLTASWVAQLGSSPDVVIVDARPADTSAQGHIPGVASLPWQSLATRSSEETETGPWRDRAVEELGSLGIGPQSAVVTYDDHGNIFSARVWWALEHLGHERVAILDGGLSAWTKLGQTVSTEAPARTPTTYTGTPDPARVATTTATADGRPPRGGAAAHRRACRARGAPSPPSREEGVPGNLRSV